MTELAERPEWPLIGPEPPERVRLGGRRLDAEFFNRTCANAFGGASVVRRRALKDRLLGFSGSNLLKFSLELSDGRTAEGVVKAAYGLPPYELFFYRELAPSLRVRVPRLYGAGANPYRRGPRTLIVLEALAQGVSSNLMTESHVREALRALAQMHAQFWNDGELASYRWLPDFSQCDLAAFRAKFDRGLDALWEMQNRLVYFPRVLTESTRDNLRQASHFLAPMTRRLDALPKTLVHGDANLNNFLVPANGGETAIIDWPNMCRGPAILDLVYFAHIQSVRTADKHGRPIMRPPILEWNRLASLYFDELESALGVAIDREHHLAAAPIADACITLRHWIPAFGISFAMSRPGLIFGRTLGWLFRRLVNFDPFVDALLRAPIQRVVDNRESILG